MNNTCELVIIPYWRNQCILQLHQILLIHLSILLYFCPPKGEVVINWHRGTIAENWLCYEAIVQFIGKTMTHDSVSFILTPHQTTILERKKKSHLCHSSILGFRFHYSLRQCILVLCNLHFILISSLSESFIPQILGLHALPFNKGQKWCFTTKCSVPYKSMHIICIFR